MFPLGSTSMATLYQLSTKSQHTNTATHSDPFSGGVRTSVGRRRSRSQSQSQSRSLRFLSVSSYRKFRTGIITRAHTCSAAPETSGGPQRRVRAFGRRFAVVCYRFEPKTTGGKNGRYRAGMARGARRCVFRGTAAAPRRSTSRRAVSAVSWTRFGRAARAHTCTGDLNWLSRCVDRYTGPPYGPNDSLRATDCSSACVRRTGRGGDRRAVQGFLRRPTAAPREKHRRLRSDAPTVCAAVFQSHRRLVGPVAAPPNRLGGCTSSSLRRSPISRDTGSALLLIKQLILSVLLAPFEEAAAAEKNKRRGEVPRVGYYIGSRIPFTKSREGLTEICNMNINRSNRADLKKVA